MEPVVDQVMNLRLMSLALVALLGTAGCVSVPAEAERPAPAVSARPGNAPAVQASASPTAPAAVHDALGKAEERPHGEKKRKAKRTVRERPPVRQPVAVAPPARRPAGTRPPRGVRPRPQPRHAHPPRVGRPQDMRAVCATGRGVASADIVALCRATYGR
ncbi:hypothetical protein [Streptomyces sp. NPDC049944]|uniref:hypothetical protein n=1 Tax=Streptomyces sp. NPDC049944 TaxID=3155657 RepID=UPI003449EB35